MNKIYLSLLTFLFFGCNNFDVKKNVIYLVGDSTMSEKLPEKRPETGWGEMLNEFFIDGIKIENHAKNGRSTRTFIEEKRWEKVVGKLQKGDHVFIQFGHNDAKKESERYASPEQYKKNFSKFIKEVRDRKSTPVLLTPVVRRRFDKEGTFYDTHADYPMQIRQLAKEENVLLIDMHELSMVTLIQLGEEGSKSLFLLLEKGAYPNYPEGLDDNTHFSPKGAKIMANLVVGKIRQSDLVIRKYLKAQ